MTSNQSERPAHRGLMNFERINHFDGMLLTARDMRTDQRFHRNRLDTVAQHVLGDGIVCGLNATVEQTTTPEGDDRLAVTVSAGFGLDCHGNLVVVENEATRHVDFESVDDVVHLALEYEECSMDRVPMLGSEDACEERCCYSRILETFEVTRVDAPPEPKSVREVLFPSKGAYNNASEKDSVFSGIATSYHTVAETDGDDGSGGDGNGDDSSAETEGRHACSSCENPQVFLGSFEAPTTGTVWSAERVPLPFVYTNDMLFAGLARHATAFDNPHQAGLAVFHPEGIGADDDPTGAGARLRVRNDQSPDRDVTLRSSDGNVSITAFPGVQKEIDLQIPGFDDLVDDVARLKERLPLLERYVRDKAMRTKREAYEHVETEFAGELAGLVASEVVTRTENGLVDPQIGLDGASYRTREAFGAFVHDPAARAKFPLAADDLDVDAGDTAVTLEHGGHTFTLERADYEPDIQVVDGGIEMDATVVELEQLLADLLSGVASPIDVGLYDQALVELDGAIDPADEMDALEVAVAQDQVSETAKRLVALEAGEPVSAFLGQTGVDLRGAPGIPDGGGVDLVGISGSADGVAVAIGDVTAADVTAGANFAVGGYARADDDQETLVLVVQQPRVIDVTLTYDGRDVTDGTIPEDADQPLVVTAAFNFETVEGVTVTVEDDDGLELLTAAIADSGGAVEFDVSDLDAGRNEVTVAGENQLSAASQTVSVRVRRERFELSVEPESVEPGERVKVTVTADAAGGNVFVLLDRDSAVLDRIFATQVFQNTGALRRVNQTETHFFAQVALGRDGSGSFTINSTVLDADATHRLLASTDPEGEDVRATAEFAIESRNGIRDVRGIGESRLDRFIEAGVVTVPAILELEVEEIVRIANVTPSEAIRILDSAREINTTLTDRPVVDRPIVRGGGGGITRPFDFDNPT